MPNPFYTPKQKTYLTLIASQVLVFQLILILLKIKYAAAFAFMSWYIVLLPVLFPVISLIGVVIVMMVLGFFMNLFNKEQMKNFCGIIEHDYGCNCIGDNNEISITIKNRYHREYYLDKPNRQKRRLEKKNLKTLKKNRR